MRRLVLIALPLLGASCAPVGPQSAELRLVNPNPIAITVEAVPAGEGDCAAAAAGATPTRLTVPKGGTGFIAVPDGSDMCWRERAIDAAPASPWSGWGRAYLYAVGTQSVQL